TPHPPLFPYTTLFRSQPAEAFPQTGVGDRVGQEWLTCERIDRLCRNRGGLDERVGPIRLGRVGVFAPVQPSALAANVTHLDEERSEEHTSELQSPYDL